MTYARRIALLAFTAPLALALSACGDDAAVSGEGVTGEPVAAVDAPAGASWEQTVSRTEEGGWLVGNPDAPIQLVEYGSLTCPACASFSADGSEALHRDYIESGRVNFEFRTLLIHGVADLVLSRMLECGPATSAVPLADQIWGQLDAQGASVFDTTNSAALEAANALPPEQRLGALGEAAGVIEWFAQRGISREAGMTCLNDVAAAQALADTTQASAEERQVNSTPTFFLNGERIEGTGWQAVEAALQRAGARE